MTQHYNGSQTRHKHRHKSNSKARRCILLTFVCQWWIKMNQREDERLVTTSTGNKVMKQVLEMFQIKMEGPDVNQKKIYRGKKKKSNQRRPRVAWFPWQICSLLKAANVIYDDKFIAARRGENRAENQRFDSLVKRLLILSYWQASQGWRHTLCAFQRMTLTWVTRRPAINIPQRLK